MPERTLTVNIVGDDADLRRAFARSSRDAQTFQGKVGGTTAGLTRNFVAAGVAAGATAISFQAVTAGIAASVSNASDLGEQISRTKVILGDAADEAINWSTTTAQAFGISQRAALAATSTFAGLFQTVGVSQRQAGELSRSLVQLAADLASLQNSSPEEALVALRSGLAGEAEPLRRFNIFLTEARVQQEAMAESGKKNASSLTAQEKALARYNLILRDSAPAQGNFADTSGELANQSRILRAQLDDLSANIGTVLIPALTDMTSSLNDALVVAADLLVAVRGLKTIGRIDIPVEMPVEIIFTGRTPGGAKSLFDDLKNTVQDAFTAGIRGAASAASGKNPLRLPKGGSGSIFTPDSRDEIEGRPPKDSPGKVAEEAADQAEKDAKRIAKAALAADRAKRRSLKNFSELVKGLGLKLDKASLTESLNDDLGALRELERAIQRQIEREGKTFDLIDQLTQVRIRLSSLAAQQAEEGQRKQQEQLDRIADAEEKAREDRRRLAERLKAKTLGDQFEAIGLTREGDQPVPGAGSLRKRLGNLRDQVKGTALDTEKTRSQLARIAKVLSGQYGQVGKEVRSAILQMFNDIADALNQGKDKVDKQTGPLTKTTSLNSRKVLQGLGLSPEEIRALRGRLSNFNSSGVGLAGAQNSGTGSFRGGQNIVVQSDIYLDGKKIGSAVTKQQQKDNRRNPQQKRGPNRRGGV